MSRQLVDASAYSAFRRGHAEVVEAIAASRRLLVSSVVLGELLAGFAAGSRPAANRRELEAFLASPRVELVDVSAATAECYAVLFAALRARGRPLATNDLWIAACALENGAEILTTDADFLRLEQVVVRCFVPARGA